MNKPLPTLNLHKTKELILLNVQDFLLDYSPSSAFYRLKRYEHTDAYNQLNRLLATKLSIDAPYAIIADYRILAFENFLYPKALKSNPALAHIPIVAVADKNDKVDRSCLKKGVDDCYIYPFDSHDIFERIEFLKKNKRQMTQIDVYQYEKLEVVTPSFKRVLDIIIASVALLILSPVLLLTALSIRLESKGPIIYSSRRVGKGYHTFDFYKFRSMYIDAEKRLADMQHMNIYSEKDAVFQKFKNDPRITKVGRFIRSTSIDELPQFINVLRGDMSIVGNRPLPIYEAEQLTQEDMAYRFIAPAGITGLWQVTKRNGHNPSSEERIELDVNYAKKNSLWNDIKIMLKTPFVLLQKEDV
jgi:lipopolysaccharide/colanic/teichoic acid biosynthesis glycosyltransferase